MAMVKLVHPYVCIIVLLQQAEAADDGPIDWPFRVRANVLKTILNFHGAPPEVIRRSRANVCLGRRMSPGPLLYLRSFAQCCRLFAWERTDRRSCWESMVAHSADV